MANDKVSYGAKTKKMDDDIGNKKGNEKVKGQPLMTVYEMLHTYVGLNNC